MIKKINSHQQRENILIQILPNKSKIKIKNSKIRRNLFYRKFMSNDKLTLPLHPLFNLLLLILQHQYFVKTKNHKDVR